MTPKLFAKIGMTLTLIGAPIACNGEGLEFGECCSEQEDCDSGICNAAHGACTITCDTDSDCPPEPKSGEPSCKNGFCQAEQEGDPCSS